VIANQQQYQVTLAAIARFEAALAHADTANAHLPEAIQRTMKASVTDQLEELRREAAEYEAAHGLNISA
jgi:hypothetical protein